MKRALSILLSLLIAAAPAGAAVPEICGDGIDNVLATGGSANGTKGSCPAGYMDPIWGNGCDRKCPGVDKDDDGYTSDGSLGTAGTTNTDCDDTRRDVYPGVYVPNSWTTPTGYKLCQTNGSYGSTTLNATTPLCEATGSGVCKYIGCASGNNSNSGTYASPYLTIGKVSGGSSGSPPASPYSLNPDDFVYLLDGTCSTTFTAGDGDKYVGDFTRDGTSGHPITIKNYPGSTAAVVTTDGGGFRLNSVDYYNFQNIQMSTSNTGSTNSLGIFALNGSNVNVTRSYFYDSNLYGDNNNSCVHFAHMNGGTVDHSWFKECKANRGNLQGGNPIEWLDDDGIATECQNHSAKWNTFWFSSFSSSYGGCLYQKHGCTDSDVGANNHPIMYNSLSNCTAGVWWNSSAIRFQDNVVAASGAGTGDSCFRLFYNGDSGPQEDNQITYNTILDCGNAFSSSYPWYGNTSDEMLFNHNLIRDPRSSYLAGNADGVITIDTYGSDSQEGQYRTNQYLISDYNYIYNANTSLVFSYFRATSGAGGHGPAGNAGADYSLGGWQGLGYDTHSTSGNPSIDSDLRCQAAGCVDQMGRRYTGASGSTTTTTSTTSTTSTTTSVAPGTGTQVSPPEQY